ncbi:MAG: glycoside hydrolase family 2 TIM barrel-domain containing protein [Candidatus Marinimicrobia bacterium]|nr:glycoside hydrolase family 2 TIM barrel-domain containing protein [Candidatus Neomarinimicrobiota bacterium]
MTLNILEIHFNCWGKIGAKLIAGIVLTVCTLFAHPTKTITEELIQRIGNQLLFKENIIDGRLPEYTENGRWVFRDKVNWFSGMTAGELFTFYEMTGEEIYKILGLKYTDSLIPYATINYTHDMGFIFMPSVVKAYSITGDERYRRAGITAAEMLAKRFNDHGQFIRAWGTLSSESRAGWMIIDTMMNLELLFWAAEETGNWELYNIAYRHAVTAMKTLIRPDGGSWHVAEFDPNSGDLKKLRTHQGYRDESTWSRGQAWGIAGFAKTYQYTQDPRFYATAKQMAKYFIDRLPDDGVPVWDLDLIGKSELKDASAAAIAAVGLFDLADLSKTKEDYDFFQKNAVRITQSLLDNYLFTESVREYEEGILLHTLYHYHKNWGIDESFPAGDYYLIQSLKSFYDSEKDYFFIEDSPERQCYSLNKKWAFLKENIPDPSCFFLATSPWVMVDLPHTWNTDDVMDPEPGYRRDGNWYEKTIFIPETSHDSRILLSFEGVNTYSEVWINGEKTGGHTGGYLSFEVDITPYVKENEENQILVYASNAINRNIIPSQKSDFFIYGGITRDVYLKIVPNIYMEKINVLTLEVSEKSASTIGKIWIQNKSKKAQKVTVSAEICNSNGNVVAEVNEKVKVSKGESIHTFSFPHVNTPDLWSPENPVLYTVTVSLDIGKNRQDRLTDRIGYRWFEFEENGPFYLNGKRLLLRGTHRHEEHAYTGAAMSNAMHWKDMGMIKELGANFVRLAHYPQDPEVYKACDELGLLVWDELPWCRGGMGGLTWQANTLTMLEEMITQNINHPSIIIWSLGNELYWLPDFPEGDNPARLREFLLIIEEKAKELDPTRVTAMRKYYDDANVVDVFSPSIWAGWYSGVYTEYKDALLNAREKYPRFLHMEYGGSSHVGRHDENPVDGKGIQIDEGWEESVNQVRVKNIAQSGDWSENYMVDLFDWHLRISEQLEWFTGNAQWAVKDFGTPLRPENPIPYMNQKGLFDRAGNPKDVYYVFKSYWTRDDKHNPFVYIESHTWTERQGPKGLKRNVCVFSNCDAVEFFLNGVSLGKKEWDISQFPASGLNWDLMFSEGGNRLIAKGFRNGKAVTADTLDVTYWYEKNGKPEGFDLAYTQQPTGNLLVTATARDKNGRRCLDYNDRVYFYHSGDGKLLVNQGTPTGSSILEMANGQASVALKPSPGGSCTIEARNQDFKGDYLTIKF